MTSEHFFSLGILTVLVLNNYCLIISSRFINLIAGFIQIAGTMHLINRPDLAQEGAVTEECFVHIWDW